MAEISDLGPFRIEPAGARWRLTLKPILDLAEETPRDFHVTLRARLDAVLGDSAPIDIFLDLQEVPAISSRQLGLMLSLKKALAGRCDKVRVTGVRENVMRLLGITHTLQFFEIG